MWRVYARPRVIVGTRTAPLPLLPSGPGGVCSRPLHGARNLTSIYRSTGKSGTLRFAHRARMEYSKTTLGKVQESEEDSYEESAGCVGILRVFGHGRGCDGIHYR